MYPRLWVFSEPPQRFLHIKALMMLRKPHP